MPPNNTPPAQPISNIPPPTPAIQVQSAPVKPTFTNYAAAVFFTLLIIGFTFHLPTFLYIPIIVFCIAAGILFFKDMVGGVFRKTPQSSVDSVPQKRSPVMAALRIVFIILGILAICFIGLIVFAVIALSASGV